MGNDRAGAGQVSQAVPPDHVAERDHRSDRADPQAVRLERVQDRAGRRSFLEVPFVVHARDESWVAPLFIERREHLDPERNPFLKGIEIAYWVARRGDRLVGRISAQVNAKHLSIHADGTGHFGYFDVLDDSEAARALIATAAAWLEERGLTRMAGPFNPSINDECGLLVDGFTTPPAVMMPHGLPYQQRLLEALGFEKVQDLYAYWFDMQGPWPIGVEALIRRSLAMPGLTLRTIDMRRFEDEVRLVCDIFNDAWADNWGFVPITEAESLHLAKSIKPLVKAGHFAIAELDGQPAAMAVTLPNLNAAIADLGGRLLPLGWAKLLWRLKVSGIGSMRLPLAGVRRRYQTTTKGAAMIMAVIAHTRDYNRDHGVAWGELSWVLESNPRMNSLIRKVGGVPYKTYRIYARPLGKGTTSPALGG